jgi:hypothetical protein
LSFKNCRPFRTLKEALETVPETFYKQHQMTMIGLLKKGGSNNGCESTANDDDFAEDDNLNFIESLLT